jgi:hypothetical protein
MRMRHTCLIHAFYICHAAPFAHGPNPGPEFVGWPHERVSIAALAQQSEGWYAGSDTIEANTQVPRSTKRDSPNHVRVLTHTDLRVFHRRKAMSRRVVLERP